MSTTPMPPIVSLLAALAWAAPASAAPAAPPAPPPMPAAVSVSSAVGRAYTISDLYNPTRDPFRIPTSGGAAGAPSAEAFKIEDFSIHSLNLKGILRDSSGAYAILVDGQFGVGFVLKGGRVYDYRNKAVPGVTGSIQAKQKTVVLITADKDVQTLRLGEIEDDPKKPLQ